MVTTRQLMSPKLQLIVISYFFNMSKTSNYTSTYFFIFSRFFNSFVRISNRGATLRQVSKLVEPNFIVTLTKEKIKLNSYWILFYLPNKININENLFLQTSKTVELFQPDFIDNIVNQINLNLLLFNKQNNLLLSN